MSLLARYREGEVVEVWQELVDQEAAVRDAPLASEAEAVAAEFAVAVQRDLELLHEGLTRLGYHFARPGHALRLATEGAEELIRAFETEIGPLPLALRAFYLRVESVDFSGELPKWLPAGPLRADSPRATLIEPTQCYSDPLVVPALEALYRECTTRASELAELDPDEGLLVTFSPDYLGKTEGSGGLYGILLPDPCADTDLELDEPCGFVSYLRRAIAWSGFPGFAHYEGPPLTDLEQLREGLLPF